MKRQLLGELLAVAVVFAAGWWWFGLLPALLGLGLLNVVLVCRMRV